MKALNIGNKDLMGYIIIGACIIVLSASMVFALAQKGDPVDPETGCMEKVATHTVIVLDKTDSLSSSQQNFILNYVNDMKGKLQPYEKFSIFTLTESSYSNARPIFSRCNPGTGKDANQLYQNPRKIQMRFDRNFSKPLKDNMNDILSNGTGSKSPIFEMIREISYRDDFNGSVGRRTLIIISDMIHHTPEYSQYKNTPDYNRFKDQQYAFETKVELNSVLVKIVYLFRDNIVKKQGKQHLSFWNEYFDDMGAEVVEVVNVR